MTYRRTEVHELGGDDPLGHALGIIILQAWQGGVREEGETMHVIIPPMEVMAGGKTINLGEYEVRVKKV